MLRLLRTARYLKPIQVIYRIRRLFVRPRRWKGATPSFHTVDLGWVNTATMPTTLVDNGTACFLNESGPMRDWQNLSKSRLWLYNLHYFDDLNAEEAQARVDTHRSWIEDWLSENPPCKGVGWEPYPTSLRVVNWIKWLLAGNEPVLGMRQSLFQQAHVLSQMLEYHLLGNHLLANAKALVFAGSVFDGEEAAGWLEKGRAILEQELNEQVLADGGHFERSPMYHQIILMDLLDLIQLAQMGVVALHDRTHTRLKQSAASMARYLEDMLHPDGAISFFNDSAVGIAPEPKATLDYAHTLGLDWSPGAGPLCHHADSGYIVARCHNQVMLVDVALIGPDHQPGHAHADTLSFEWSVFGQRVLVNSGTSLYDVCDERLRQRGTAAHNTVVINGQNSSEVWGGFRVARRARPFNVQTEQSNEVVVVRAAHDGYHRLRPKVTHHREWRISPGSLDIHDTLKGRFHSAVAYFHVHPDVRVMQDGTHLILKLPDEKTCEVSVDGGSVSLEAGTWHPQFGVTQTNQRIAVSFTGPVLSTRLRY